MLASAGLAGTGVVSDYAGVLVAVTVSGIGIAAFHPQGARLVNRVAGVKQATAMSLFGVGGTLGFAIGPSLVTMAILHWGLRGVAVLVIPTGIMATLLSWHLSTDAGRRIIRGMDHASVASERPRDAWGPFVRLTLVVITRAILLYGINTFLPLYWIHVLHGSPAAGAMALTVFALASVVGNLFGGPLADRFGHTRIAAVAFCALLPLIPLLLWMTSRPAALGMVALIGMALSTTYSPLVSLGQRYLPNHIGLSSGVTLGVAISIGGVATPLLGQVADHYGLWAALATLSLVPIPSVLLALSLPRPDRLSLQPTART
jgi:MFS transporter, FSR family, fosmidomycin resistance protein